MPNRLIKESICTSDNLDQLTADEERFFYRLMVNCDDYGRFDGRPSILLARLFPLKIRQIKEQDIIKWIQSLIDTGLIYLYDSEGLPFIQLITWENHQQIRAKKSKYPDYENNGNHLISSASQLISSTNKCPRNPIQSNPNPIRTPQTAEIFEQFWKFYPKKKSKGTAERAFFKINPDEQLLETMISTIKRAKKSEDWLKDDGRYIPNPATWLNARGWEDEIPEKDKDDHYTGR